MKKNTIYNIAAIIISVLFTGYGMTFLLSIYQPAEFYKFIAYGLVVCLILVYVGVFLYAFMYSFFISFAKAFAEARRNGRR